MTARDKAGDDPAFMDQFRSIAGQGRALADVPAAEVTAALQQSPALLLRGFDVTTDAFRSLGKSLGVAFINQSLGATRASGDGVIGEVTYGHFSLPVHMERGYSPVKPDICMFYCIRTAPSGDGATTMADAASLYSRLPAELGQLFKSKKIVYRHVLDRDSWQARYGERQAAERMLAAHPDIPFYKFDGDSLSYHYESSAVLRVGTGDCFINSVRIIWGAMHAPAGIRRGTKFSEVCFADGTPITRAMIEAIEHAEESVKIRCLMQPGDVIVLDNYRMLHGRDAFCDRNRHIVTIFPIVSGSVNHRLAGALQPAIS